MTADLHEEGPFVDISGTYDPIRMQPVIELCGMVCKPDCIYHGIVPAGAEHKMLMGAPYEPRIYQAAANVTNSLPREEQDISMRWFRSRR